MNGTAMYISVCGCAALAELDILIFLCESASRQSAVSCSCCLIVRWSSVEVMVILSTRRQQLLPMPLLQ